MVWTTCRAVLSAATVAIVRVGGVGDCQRHTVTRSTNSTSGSVLSPLTIVQRTTTYQLTV